jgi:hypothetical protein
MSSIGFATKLSCSVLNTNCFSWSSIVTRCASISRHQSSLMHAPSPFSVSLLQEHDDISCVKCSLMYFRRQQSKQIAISCKWQSVPHNLLRRFRGMWNIFNSQSIKPTGFWKFKGYIFARTVNWNSRFSTEGEEDSVNWNSRFSGVSTLISHCFRFFFFVEWLHPLTCFHIWRYSPSHLMVLSDPWQTNFRWANQWRVTMCLISEVDNSSFMLSVMYYFD